MNAPKVLPVIPPLTGVRFLAALLGFPFHSTPFRGTESATGRFLAGIFDEMYVGVGLFFVLSGFLIAYNFLTAPRSASGF
jgi:peptidoglycan/LPS O-acetylase OafA/YrhL